MKIKKINNTLTTTEDLPIAMASSQALFHRIHKSQMLAELVETILDSAAKTSHSLYKFVESACRQIPAVGVVVESIGNAAAAIKWRDDLSVVEKKVLGIKVAVGVMGLATAIAAFSLPHLTAVLTVAGIAANLTANVIELFSLYRQKKLLEKELRSVDHADQDQQIKLTKQWHHLNIKLKKQRKKTIDKAAKVSFSSVMLIGFIAMMANPLTAVPASVVMATSVAIYICYQNRERITDLLNKVATKAQEFCKKVRNKVWEKSKWIVSPIVKKINKLSMFSREIREPQEIVDRFDVLPRMCL